VSKLHKEAKISTFSMEGRFVGFVGDIEKKPKRLRLATSDGERYIKLAKELRSTSLRAALEPGDWIQISGEQKRKLKTGELKLTAFQVKPTTPTQPPNVFQPPVAAPKTQACVMVCQKSSCRQRGAGEVCQAVTESLQKQGLQNQVAIKGTGCMKQCKQGPCVVFMPDKSRYSQVNPKNIPSLVEKHFTPKLNLEVAKPEPLPVS
jgi:(2Fe-2S) ferredoxin